ncbi:MAG: DNA recombination protein RmuC [Candidatus Cloacimonetes bacterium]|nr:DNA recombination protein RmuC [Candidatus Cloacimonadota bacterium]
MELLYLVVGMLIGGAIVGLYFFGKKSKLDERVKLLISEIDKTESELNTEREKSINSLSEIAKLETLNLNFQEKLSEQKKELEELQAKLTDAFKNLANDILEEKTKKFTEQNRVSLDELLIPLKEKIKDFESKVEQTDEKNRLSNKSLEEQINGLKELNKKMSDDANNLTKALKGDVKIQGNWGEMILERILEESGLRKGIEYETQGRGMGLKSDEGNPSKPDFVIRFPDEKHVIIDSKVSLIAYERLMNSDNDEQKKVYRKELEKSIKSHIDNLHGKYYHTREGLNTPDYVFLFMPIEASFTIALHPDSSLFKYGLDKKIIIVGPSGLMAILRTIESIWQQDNQTKNAKEIARQSGALLDKFIGFLNDLEKIDLNLKRTQNAYDDAIKKLSTGKGNLISKTKKIEILLGKNDKKIPDKFIQEELVTE